MNSEKIFDTEICNFYCDESCHTQSDGNDFVVLVSTYCRKSNLKQIRKDIIAIKKEFRLSFDSEIKWGKVSANNIELYKKIIEYVSKNSKIRIRCIIGRGKTRLDLEKYDILYNEWYQSLYFNMFKKVVMDEVRNFRQFNFFIDKQDTNSFENYNNIAKYLDFKFRKMYKFTAQPIDSKEHQLVQISDVIAGAISYTLRNLNPNLIKLQLISYIKKSFNTKLVETSSYSDKKFNVFVWDPRE